MDIVKNLVDDLKGNNKEHFSNLHRAMIQETARVVTTELQRPDSHTQEAGG